MAQSDIVPVIVTFDMPALALDSGLANDPAFAVETRLAQQRAIIARTTGLERVAAGLDRIDTSGSHLRREFRTIPAVSMFLDAQQIAALSADPSVASIVLDRLNAPSTDGTIPLIGASTLHSSGMTGSGTAIAILDTGVDHEHPMFSGRISESACFSTTIVADQVASFCPGGVAVDTSTADAGDDCPYTGDTATAVDGCGHGTHVAGTAAGSSWVDPGTGDTLIGVAPGSGIIAVQVFSQFNSSATCSGFGASTPCTLSYNSDQVAALEWLFTNRVALGVSSINMSLGGGQFANHCTSDSRVTVITNLRNAGVATVIASGNNGYNDAVGAPACIEPAITVGATTDADVVASFSNSSYVVDLLAPGVAINSAEPTIDDTPPGRARSIQGTSMATPHVAGAVALLVAANPNASLLDIETALEQTGVAVTESPSGLVRPRIRVDLAHTLLQNIPIPANDNFANATALAGGSTSVAGTNRFATSEVGEPTHAGVSNAQSVWWTWTAPASGSTTIDLSGSSFDTVIHVYTGSAVNALASVASDDDGGVGQTSSVTFTATVGTTYRIAVAGLGTENGTISLNLNQQSEGRTLIVSRAGAGSGLIASDIAGIACGADCREVYDSGTMVMLTATADAGSHFTGWAGASAGPCTGSTSTSCTVTISFAAVNEIIATFSPSNMYTVSAMASGLGQGYFADGGGTPICNGGACTQSVANNGSVTIVATPNAGSTFSSWTSGGCPTPGSATCTMTVTSDQLLTAQFNISAPPPAVAAAILPSARSLTAGGGPVTAFATVLTDGNPAQNCRFNTQGLGELQFTARERRHGGELGPEMELFDIAANGRMDLLLEVAAPPGAEPRALDVFLALTCLESQLAVIPNVNTLHLTIDEVPGTDLLSIAATPTGDGVLWMDNDRMSGAFSVAAMDLAAGHSDVFSISVDDGGQNVPLGMSLCVTDAGGACLTPRAYHLFYPANGKAPFFVAVFVRGEPGTALLFDPALVRSFVRFHDEEGVVRSLTSVALGVRN